MTVRLDVIIGRCISLTLRNPREWTFKHMTAMLCVLREGREHLHTFSAHHKSEIMAHVKHQFRSASRRAGTSQEHILKLPACFAELQREWPQVAASACAGQEPCQCPIDVRLFHSVGQSFRCRGGVNAAPVPTLSLSGGAGNAGINDNKVFDHMQKFAIAMVQSMSKMQEQQNRIFQPSGINAAASHQSFHSRAERMPTLTNGSRADVAPTLHIWSCADVVPTLPHGSALTLAPAASTLARASSLDSQSVVGHADSTLGTASAMDSQSVVCHEAAGADASVEKATDAINSTCSLLNALEDREREKVLQGRAKAKANAQSQSSAKDKDHTHKFKEHTPKKRCSRKTSDKMDTPEEQQKAIVAKLPRFSLEKDRGQFMCRTGVGGAGSTHKISFEAGKQYKSELLARKASEHLLRGECARRGFECNSSSWLGRLQRLRIVWEHELILRDFDCISKM